MSTWPKLDFAAWQPTGHSLHMWSQIVGKFRLANTPWINHSWQATFYVSARGLTTGPVPGPAASYEAVFDFVDQKLRLLSSDGRAGAIDLEDMSVHRFHDRFRDLLRQLGAPADFHHFPNEVPDPVPFADQTGPGRYDPAIAADFWRALVAIEPVFTTFRSGFIGKVSPVHLFWGSFDLAVTRFSGRPAPLHPGGFPALPDAVTREAYSHEVSSAGFWPGGGPVEEAAFYSYAYPTPGGFSDAAVAPDGAFFHRGAGEFILPYEAVRTADDPAAALLAFLDTTYGAAASLGDWDRAALECDYGEPRVPRALSRETPSRAT